MIKPRQLDWRESVKFQFASARAMQYTNTSDVLKKSK
jgi:hypothetical protein